MLENEVKKKLDFKYASEKVFLIKIQLQPYYYIHLKKSISLPDDNK